MKLREMNDEVQRYKQEAQQASASLTCLEVSILVLLLLKNDDSIKAIIWMQ